MRVRGKGLRKKQLINNLIENFEEDKHADAANITNEKELNKVVRKVISHNKKHMMKPINTHILLK